MTFKQFKTELRSRYPFVAHYGDIIKREMVNILAPVQRRVLKSLIRSYHADTHDEEILEVLAFIKNHSVEMIPYEFVTKYTNDTIAVLTDEVSGYPFVEVTGHRVFFPKEMVPDDIRSAVKTGLVEQESLSPHCYNSGYFNFHEEGAGIFIGASDGIYCLSVLEYFSSVYLFEADQKWLTPLTMTFAPWGDKVKIIQKFVSDRDAGNEITLDTFSTTIEDDITYLQADVEGAERNILLGGEKLLSQTTRMKLSLCCYHRHGDCDELSDILRSNDFLVTCSPGYLIMWMQVPLKKPYLRKGVIYAKKFNSAEGES